MTKKLTAWRTFFQNKGDYHPWASKDTCIVTRNGVSAAPETPKRFGAVSETRNAVSEV